MKRVTYKPPSIFLKLEARALSQFCERGSKLSFIEYLSPRVLDLFVLFLLKVMLISYSFANR